MTENKSLLLYARLAARLEHFMSLRGLPPALFEIYTCVVLRLFFILCVLCAVKNKFTVNNKVLDLGFKRHACIAILEPLGKLA